MNLSNAGPVVPGSVVVASIPDWDYLCGDEPEAWWRTIAEQVGHDRFVVVVVVPPSGVRVVGPEGDLVSIVREILQGASAAASGIQVVAP